MPRLAAATNLKVFLRTAVTNTTRDAEGRVVSITCVQRTPIDPATEWGQPLSKTVDDWYSPVDSAAFTKQVVTLEGKIFIEATELGDVLVTGGFPFTQGFEVPYENSTTSNFSCGQATTLTYYPTLLGEVCVSAHAVMGVMQWVPARAVVLAAACGSKRVLPPACLLSRFRVISW